MQGLTYWVEFQDHVIGVPTEDGEKSFLPGEIAELSHAAMQTLRFAWYKLIPPPGPTRRKKNKREVDKVNRTRYG